MQKIYSDIDEIDVVDGSKFEKNSKFRISGGLCTICLGIFIFTFLLI